jgi:hypothetical protein
MRIPISEGVYIEPDDGSRDTQFHKRIVRVEPVTETRSGHYLDLECGHRVMAFGDLAHANGVILCDQCRKAAQQ